MQSRGRTNLQQSFFAQTELVSRSSNRSVRGERIGPCLDDELDGTSLDFVDVFHWQERISLLQSLYPYYLRGESLPFIHMQHIAQLLTNGPQPIYDKQTKY